MGGEDKDQTGWGVSTRTRMVVGVGGVQRPDWVQGPDWLRGEYKDQIGGGGGGVQRPDWWGGGGEYKDQIGWGVPGEYKDQTGWGWAQGPYWLGVWVQEPDWLEGEYKDQIG